jgi:hypothetical protein
MIVGHDITRPEELERTQRHRTLVLDHRQLHRAGFSEYRLGGARLIPHKTASLFHVFFFHFLLCLVTGFPI